MNEPQSLTDVARELDLSLNGPVQMVQEVLSAPEEQAECLIVNVPSGLA